MRLSTFKRQPHNGPGRDREAYIVEGVLPEAVRGRLYFEVDSGLLVRVCASSQTVLGLIPWQVTRKLTKGVG